MSTAPPPHHEEVPPVRGSLVLRFGALAGASALAAAACTLPAALRTSQPLEGTHGTLSVWLSLTAATVLPMIAGVAVARRTRESLWAFGLGGTAVTLGFAAWLALVFGALLGSGALLRATTHHHGLAAVTFSVGAVAVALALALFVRRCVAIAIETRRPFLARAFGAAAGLVVGGGAITGAHLAVAGSSSALVVDVLSTFVVLTLFSRPIFAVRRGLAMIGPPLVATALVLGTSTLRASPALRAAIAESAPVFHPLVALLVGD
jgi:hypothetical protein